MDASTLNYFFPISLSKDDIPANIIGPIYLCIYTINTNSIHPFIQYLLYYNSSKKGQSQFILPFIKNKRGLSSFALKEVNKIFSEWTEKPIYQGYKKYGDNYYLFFEKPSEKHMILYKSQQSAWWWTMVSEIIDIKKIINLSISSLVSEFFIHHRDLLFLYDSNNNIYESPTVGYHGCHRKMVAFITIFGIYKSSPFASLGPYYYFTTYNRAYRYAIWSSDGKPLKINNEVVTTNEYGKYTEGGLVRFALFLGNTKLFMNRENDAEDNSQISQDKKNDAWIGPTLKIRDTDGKWAKKYNSAVVGRQEIIIEGKRRMLHPLMVTRDYNQQEPLSYHYIETTNAPEKISRDFVGDIV